MKNMKKQYVKPELYFENFELSTSIATCTNPTNTPNGGTCGIDLGDGTVAFIQGGVCNYQPEDGPKYCYDVPSDTNKLFNS